MRVVSLQAQNMMRLSAVEIAWDPATHVLTIGGKNGAGKSSVVNSLAMALGGTALCPDEPLKQGEATGFVQVDLDEYLVRREFYRETIGVPPNAEVVTKSRLTVKSKEGHLQGSPQKLLDKFLGKLTFDPTAFVNEDTKKQDEILRKIVGLDVSALEETRKHAATRLTDYKRDLNEAVTVLMSLQKFDAAPAEEVPVQTVLDEMAEASAAKNAAEAAGREVKTLAAFMETTSKKMQSNTAEIARLQLEIDALVGDNVDLRGQLDRAKDAHATALQTADALAKSVPDIEAIKQKAAGLEETNRQVRANVAYRKQESLVASLKIKADTCEETIAHAVNAKRAALEAAQFPVPGLSLSDDGVVFNGVPFKQASTAEQIRVSVAIGFALNPGLKLLMVRNGNALDEDSMKLVAEEAQKAGGQILMEYVTKHAEDVSVYIEDGHNV